MSTKYEQLNDERYDQYATDIQKRYLEAYRILGSFRAVERELGLPADDRVRKSLLGLLERGANMGLSPAHDMEQTIPSPFRIRGHSTEYTNGKVSRQWVKTERDRGLSDGMVRNWVEALVADAKATSVKPLIAPDHTDDKLLNVYPMGDPHFGMFSSESITGHSFDLDRARLLMGGAIDTLIHRAPAATTGLLLNLGDFYHADDSRNVTPASEHRLDVDSKDYGEIMMVGFWAMVRAIRRMREKHRKVIVWNIPGNHDPHASFALAGMLWAFFHNDPDIEIPVNRSWFWYLRFGKTLIGSHHGHGPKMSELPQIMATDRKEDWAASDYRYWLLGHFHHKQKDKEAPGALVETFNTLAAGDNWHFGKGYRARRNMQAITYHEDFGERLRVTCDLAEIEQTLGA